MSEGLNVGGDWTGARVGCHVNPGFIMSSLRFIIVGLLVGRTGASVGSDVGFPSGGSVRWYRVGRGEGESVGLVNEGVAVGSRVSVVHQTQEPLI